MSENNPSNNNPNNQSTLNSYINSATETIQSGISSITGSSTNQQPDQSQSQSQGNPKWNQTMGSAKESLGNMTGNESLRKAGIDQNTQGKAEEAKGQLKDWGEGMTDRAQGAVGSVGAAVTGDREEEEKWRQIHDAGKMKQRGAEGDMESRGGY